jgi:hypothetical protein
MYAAGEGELTLARLLRPGHGERRSVEEGGCHLEKSGVATIVTGAKVKESNREVMINFILAITTFMWSC